MNDAGRTVAPASTPRRHVSGPVALAVVIAVAATLGVVVVTSGPPPTVGAPAGLRARSRVCVVPECDRVEAVVALAWSVPDAEVRTIEVLADGAVLAGIGPNTTGYEIRGLWIDRSYVFGVRAVGPDGAGPTSAVQVRTPVPPTEDSQLDGAYRVREAVRRATNLSTVEGMVDPRPGRKVTSMWSFFASCAGDTGACAADWFRWGPLVNDGRRYEGTFRSRPAHCAGGRRAPTTTQMRLVVERGTASGGRWVVGRFRGVMILRFSCPGAGRSAGVLQVRGRLLA